MKAVEISYSYEVQQALFHACEAAEKNSSTSVGTEHLLIGILKNHNAKLTEALTRKGITDQKIFQEVQILFGFDVSDVHHVLYTNTVQSILKDAELLAQKKRHVEVSMDDLSLSLLNKENNVAIELLKRSGIAIDELIQELNQDDLFLTCRELKNMNQHSLRKKGKAAMREKEIEMMMYTLIKMEKSNCVLTGPAGVGKTAIVEELAAKIARRQVPDQLKNCIIAELNINHMVAGTKYRGEFEGKIQKLMNELNQHPNVILFIDELHLIVGAGKAEGSLDIASVLKPVLSRGGIRIIGATTCEEYERWIAKDKALQRRFVRIDIKEPDEQMTFHMLKEKAKDLQAYHEIRFQKGLLKQSISLSGILFPHLSFPDKAIDLLDISCSLAKIRNQDMVTYELMKEAASSLSHLPFSFDLDSNFEAELRTVISDLSVQKIRFGIDYALQHHCFSFVCLDESEDALTQVQHKLKNLLSTEVREVSSEIFRMMSIQDWIKSICSQLHQGFFHIIRIHGAETMKEDLIRVMNESVLKEMMNLFQVSDCMIGLFLLSFENNLTCGYDLN